MRDKLSPDLFLHVNWHITLEQVVDNELGVFVLGGNLDGKETSLLVNRNGKLKREERRDTRVRDMEDKSKQARILRTATYIGSMIEEPHNSSIIGIVLERKEDRTMSVTVEDTGSVGELHENSIYDGRLATILDCNRKWQIPA